MPQFSNQNPVQNTAPTYSDFDPYMGLEEPAIVPEYPTNQEKNFDRIDARGSFLVGTRDAVRLRTNRTSQGKICIEFVKYDPARGNKSTGQGRFYLSFADFEQLRLRFTSPSLPRDMATPNNMLFQQYAGTKDGRSRILEVTVGAKPGMVLVTYKEGPGKRNATGGIFPAGKPDLTISVPVLVKRFRAFLELGNVEVQNALLDERLSNIESMLQELLRKCS